RVEPVAHVRHRRVRPPDRVARGHEFTRVDGEAARHVSGRGAGAGRFVHARSHDAKGSADARRTRHVLARVGVVSGHRERGARPARGPRESAGRAVSPGTGGAEVQALSALSWGAPGALCGAVSYCGWVAAAPAGAEPASAAEAGAGAATPPVSRSICETSQPP